ncbi:hypothetical protein [Pseudomonas laurylsulfatiphila]|uniref:hypothetical protein n=1 Tax=Pseudomonas laurylsulfatiphila TaxID=2011015 RepID=UPI003D23C696|nr:hypothetical protein [Pseudomonas reinekei]
MEWYESLFLQMCTHALSRARVADLRRQDSKLNLYLDQTFEIVSSYRKDIQLAFDLRSAVEKLAGGSEYVIAVFVHDNQFSTALRRLKEKHHVILSATMETAAQPNSFSSYYVDVAICRGPITTAQ